MERILLIDDEQPTLDMLSLFLNAYGYKALTADSGEKGISLFEAEQPGIVMTDIKMPGMDGIEVLKRIKAINPATEVIVVTGHGDMDLAIQALNLNATDFINKPVQKEALEGALRRAEERMAASRLKENQGITHFRGDVAVMEIHGNVTSSSEPFIQEAYNKIIAQETTKVVLCFDEHATINGAGIALLTQLLLEGTKKGQKICITGVSENFNKVFDIVGITRFATLHEDVDKAVRSLEES